MGCIFRSVAAVVTPPSDKLKASVSTCLDIDRASAVVDHTIERRA